jgi:hypothetical protein
MSGVAVVKAAAPDGRSMMRTRFYPAHLGEQSRRVSAATFTPSSAQARGLYQSSTDHYPGGGTPPIPLASLPYGETFNRE